MDRLFVVSLSFANLLVVDCRFSLQVIAIPSLPSMMLLFGVGCLSIFDVSPFYGCRRRLFFKSTPSLSSFAFRSCFPTSCTPFLPLFMLK
jgi:hypothetical protein